MRKKKRRRLAVHLKGKPAPIKLLAGLDNLRYIDRKRFRAVDYSRNTSEREGRTHKPG